MDTHLAKLNNHKTSHSFLNKKSTYSFSSRKNMDSTLVFENSTETYLSNDPSKFYVSHEALVNFIIDYGIKVKENESDQYKKFMFSYHICIEFYGIKYYIPFYNFNQKERRIFDHLMAQNQTF